MEKCKGCLYLLTAEKNNSFCAEKSHVQEAEAENNLYKVLYVIKKT